eukprot:1158610-Pelagomonas_calceolata.AAC.5
MARTSMQEAKIKDARERALMLHTHDLRIFITTKTFSHCAPTCSHNNSLAQSLSYLNHLNQTLLCSCQRTMVSLHLLFHTCTTYQKTLHNLPTGGLAAPFIFHTCTTYPKTSHNLPTGGLAAPFPADCDSDCAVQC